MSERLLKIGGAAEMLGMSASTLYQWSRERKIPSVKLSAGALRFKLSDVEKMIKNSERPALRS